MQTVFSALHIATSMFSTARKLLEGSYRGNDARVALDDDFVEVDPDIGTGFCGGQLGPLNSDDSFEADLDLEDLAIFKCNKERRYLPNFNFAQIGKTPSEAKLLEENCSLENLKDTYSREDNGQILLITSKLICVLDSESKRYIKRFNKRDVEKVIFLSNTIFFQRKSEVNKPREVIIADRRRHLKLEQYLEQFWTNYL